MPKRGAEEGIPMEDAQGLIRTNARMPQEHLISSRDGQDGHYILDITY